MEIPYKKNSPGWDDLFQVSQAQACEIRHQHGQAVPRENAQETPGFFGGTSWFAVYFPPIQIQ